MDDRAGGVGVGGFEVEGGFSDFGAVEGEYGECREFRADCGGGGFEKVGFWGFDEKRSGGGLIRRNGENGG